MICPAIIEAWTTLPSSAEVKDEWSYTSTYSFSSMALYSDNSPFNFHL